MNKETLLEFALMASKFVMAVVLIVVGQRLLDVPDPEDFWQFLRHICGVILVWFALDIDWMNNGK